MNQFYNQPTEALMSELEDCISLKAEVDNRMEPLRAEIHRRMKTDGLKTDEHNGWVYNLKVQPLSMASLKRAGWDETSIPPECISEKVVPDINWEGVKAALNIESEYTLAVSRKKAK